ncbi:Melanotransferrin [Eumeta japonica]|uniref:Melanotransferrin n=1 Tax=Eumeta variegata TaxID=151549 RepID=A0A4C1Z3V6_EUMVA|nr:Melanotransferrin [Eumeta japonica]
MKFIAFVSFVVTGHNKSILSTSECNYAKAVAEFFNGTCAPGALDTMHQLYDSSFSASSLCDVCKSQYTTVGTWSNATCSADWSNVYFGNNGTLSCLADQSADVAFVEVQNLNGIHIFVPPWSRMRFHCNIKLKSLYLKLSKLIQCRVRTVKDRRHLWDDRMPAEDLLTTYPPPHRIYDCPRTTVYAHLGNLNIPANAFRPLCSGNNSLGAPGAFITDDCLMSLIIDSEVLARRNDPQLTSLASLLKHLDHNFGYTVSAASRLIDLQVYSPFNGTSDLLFKDSVIGLTSPSNSTFAPARNYFQLFQHLEGCTGGANGLAAKSGFFSILSLVFVSLLSKWVF